MKNLLITFAIIFSVTFSVVADTTFINHSLGYKAYLPDNWVMEAKSDTQHFFYDTTFTYGARLNVVRHTKDATYDTPAAWTRAHFIAYKMYMDYYPFGTVLFHDTAATETQGDHWATEMYLRFYTDDTANYSWDEYVRYTATEKYGWELYAIGDTVDLSTNIGFYGAILKIIDLKDEYLPIIVADPHSGRDPSNNIMYKFPMEFTEYAYTPLGRRVPLADLQRRKVSHGMYFIKKNKIVNLKQYK